MDLPLAEIERVANQQAFGKNILYLKKIELIKKIRQLQPDIARVEIQKKYPAELKLNIFKFPIVAELRTNSQEKIFLNENGVRVFEETPPNNLLVLVVTAELPLEEPQKVLIAPQHLTEIREGLLYFEATLNLPVRLVKYLPSAREVHFKTEQNFAVWLTLSLDLRSQIDKLVQVADKFDFPNQKYHYLDLRPRNKIFFLRK